MSYSGAVFFVAGLAVWRGVNSLDNGLALTPPMGFNTWERYRCEMDCEHFPDGCINEDLIIRIADEMKKGGYLDAGYEYLVIDDCWMARQRDEAGNLFEDPERFPRGMEFLVDYVHGLGLKFGIYENHGKVTCMGFPGTHGQYIEKDAKLFSKWNVDFVKLDGCFTPLEENDFGYPEFGKYLKEFGRSIVYSCSWPFYMFEKGSKPNYTAVKEHCHLWRNYHDVQDDWYAVRGIADYYAQNQDEFERFHGPGHWFDADMLIIGNYALSTEQAKTQMALWCILGVPLFMSTDLTTIRPELKAILLNKVAIGINQDSMGKMGRQIYNKDGIQIWKKPIRPVFKDYCSYAIVIVNVRTDGTPRLIHKTAKELGLYNPKGYVVEDVFGADGPKSFYLDDVIVGKIPPSGCGFWKFTVTNDYGWKAQNTKSTECKDTRQIKLSDIREPYSADLVGVIYLAVAFVMLFIFMKALVGQARRRRSLNAV